MANHTQANGKTTSSMAKEFTNGKASKEKSNTTAISLKTKGMVKGCTLGLTEKDMMETGKMEKCTVRANFTLSQMMILIRLACGKMEKERNGSERKIITL